MVTASPQTTADPPASSEPTGWDRGVAAIGYGLPFLLVVYLAFAGGGYDPVVYGQVGVICWWVVTLGALVGLLPLARISGVAWVGLGLLVAFALWTALGISWSESSERSVAELARVASFVGVFALAISIQGRALALRRTVYAVAAAIGVVTLFALFSRLHPELFPEIQAARFLDDVEARLSYPLEYWNALAALIAIGIPLLLSAAMSARNLIVQAIAAAALPMMALTAFFTLSRGGAFAIAIAIVAFVLLYPRRLAAAPTMVLAAIGAAILIAFASGKDALEDGLSDSTAISEGNQVLLLTILVCAVVGLGHLALAHARRRGIGPKLEVSRQATLAGVAIVGAIVLVGAIAAGAPSKISDRIDEFTEPIAPDPTAGASRYESLSGNGRYQLWTSAVDANGTEPLTGIGPGTFEYWWAEDRPMDAYARSAHSLYLNSLAEVGIVGMLLIAAFVLVPIGVGLRRWFRQPTSRELLAGAIGGAVTFAVGVGVDRLWELAVLPVVFLLLAAALLIPGDDAVEDEPATEGAEPLPIAGRVGVVVVAIVATIAIAIPTASLVSVRESQADVREGDLDAALDAAREAGDIQPYAATPDYQEAQVLELQGDLDGAAAAAREATENEPTNWRTWLVLARIEAEAGNVNEALDAFERAQALNPLSDFLR